MKVLLDTQCWLWMNLTPDRLSPSTQAVLGDGNTELVLSVASVWEIVIKHASGKLRLPLPPREYVVSRMTRDRVQSLPIEREHALQVQALPSHHRDPFDRILIAQALVEHLPVMSADPHFALYDLQLLGS